MTKRKDALVGFQRTTGKVTELLAKKSLENWRTWTVAELKLVVGWKQGHSPKEPYNESYKMLKKPALQQLYQEKYEAAPDPVDSMWTDDMEAELKRLESGEIQDIYIDYGLEQAMERDDEEIATRLGNKAPSRRMKILTTSFHSLAKQKRRDLLNELELLVDVDEEESIGDVDSGVFDDDSAEPNDDDGDLEGDNDEDFDRM